jgi:uncharacterized protein YraI
MAALRLSFLPRSLLLAAALLLCVALFPQNARAGLEPGPGNAWLAVASRTDANDAIAIAQSYSGRFPTAVVFQSVNGFYAVTLGWMNKAEGDALLRNLVSQGAVPADAYFTAGSRFVRAVWSANGAHTYAAFDLYAATQIGGRYNRSVDPSPQPVDPGPVVADAIAPRNGQVSGLNPKGDNFLSLRSGPGSNYQELARMQPGTGVTATGVSGDWYEVSLSNGMRGWAFGKFIRFNAPAQDLAARSQQADVPVIGPETVTKTQPGEVKPKAAQEVAKAQQPNSASVTTSEPQKPIADQKRVALVLGNSDYKNATVLPNPRNDAAAITEKLTALGFTVISGLDGGKADMENSIREFVKVLDGADVALLFYAGHGMQVNGNNYLIPVDAKLEESTALDFETINLAAILNFMKAEDRISIVLIDACRDNPLARTFQRSLGKSRSALIGRGLARTDVGSGEILISYATAPGETAADGEGSNSPYTTALMKHLDAKGIDVELMMKRVKRDVYDATQEVQEPFVESGLRREFHFNPQPE